MRKHELPRIKCHQLEISLTLEPNVHVGTVFNSDMNVIFSCSRKMQEQHVAEKCRLEMIII